MEGNTLMKYKEYMDFLSLIDNIKKHVYDIAIKTKSKSIMRAYERLDEYFMEKIIEFEKFLTK